MSATEIMQQIEELPDKEQQELFVFLTQKIMGGKSADAKQWLGKKLSFEQACDVVFRENRQLLNALAK
jgi:5-carboxymethyl-2-hydroxymuconate isomerase